MASRKSKTVYERIYEIKEEIMLTENKLAELNNNLEQLNHERDNLEMHQLFDFIRSNGITLEQAKALMSK